MRKMRILSVSGNRVGLSFSTFPSDTPSPSFAPDLPPFPCSCAQKTPFGAASLEDPRPMPVRTFQACSAPAPFNLSYPPPRPALIYQAFEGPVLDRSFTTVFPFSLGFSLLRASEMLPLSQVGYSFRKIFSLEGQFLPVHHCLAPRFASLFPAT